MKTTDKILSVISQLIRPLHHYIKIALLYTLKNHNIRVKFPINYSDAKMDLNLGYFGDFWIFAEGTYEGDWIKKVKNLVRGKTFIDVGAHIGIYSLSLFREARSIYAFEAEKKNYKRLRHHIKINSIKNVKAERKMVSDKDGVLEKLHINKENEGMHSSTVSYLNSKVQKVRSIKLDSFIKKYKIKNIGLIKIDVEGGELKALRGLSSTLKHHHPPILIEFNQGLAELSGHNLMDIYNLIIKYKYKAYRLRSNRLTGLHKKAHWEFDNENVLFKPF